MKNREKIVKSVMTGVLALTVLNTTLNSTDAIAKGMEKCYGVANARMNDCKTATESCAGSATQSRQPDAFIFLPKGICNKIVGGRVGK
jgi:uncharacterized membrane protein